MIKNSHTNKRFIPLLLMGACLPLIVACGKQYTPSMMNTSSVELSRETLLDQIFLKNLDQKSLAMMADQYRKNGNGALDLTMTYDPKSRHFTAMKALHELKAIRASLHKEEVREVTTQTLAVPGGSPSLMVSYDLVKAQAPSDCTPMPGLENNETGRFIGDYKFGCATESLIAQQIAQPSDLEGNADLAKRDARRDSIMIEGYAAGVPRERMEGLERDNLTSE